MAKGQDYVESPTATEYGTVLLIFQMWLLTRALSSPDVPLSLPFAIINDYLDDSSRA